MPGKSKAGGEARERRELQEGLRALRRGAHLNVVQSMSGLSLQAKDPEVKRAALTLQIEAHFRAGVTAVSAEERVAHLRAALRYPAAPPKVRFHLGIALMQQGAHAEALAEFDAVALQEPARPGLAYLRSLAQIAARKPWDDARLTPAERNTLAAAEAFTRGGRLDPPAEPLPGSGSELWQGLVALTSRADAQAADLFAAAALRHPRKPVAGVLHYYRGVALMRTGAADEAEKAWRAADAAGFRSPGLTRNLNGLWRSRAFELAATGHWADVVKFVEGLPDLGEIDPALAQVAATAHDHLAYDASQQGKWPQAAEHWRMAFQFAPNRHISQNLALAEEALENWAEAADAWRDMVRRRPRKADHPDYLTDGQVTAIWVHAAQRYERGDEIEEAETCLKNALKYAPDDVKLRTAFADLLAADGRWQAADTQLEEALRREPQNLDALVLQAQVREQWDWDFNAALAWRRVLAVDPSHPEARDALAANYVARAGSPHDRMLRSPQAGDPIKLLEDGLREAPGHPQLLMALGSHLVAGGRRDEGVARLLEAVAAAGQGAEWFGPALHELLHAQAEDQVRELLPTMRGLPNLLPAFWVHQARQALSCKLGDDWARLFVDEALGLVGQPWVDDTRAGVLLDAFLAAHEAGAAAFAAEIDAQIRREAALSGAVEYLDAHRANFELGNTKAAKRLIREAIKVARRAGDAHVLRHAEAAELLLTSPFGGAGQTILKQLLGL